MKSSLLLAGLLVAAAGIAVAALTEEPATDRSPRYLLPRKLQDAVGRISAMAEETASGDPEAAAEPAANETTAGLGMTVDDDGDVAVYLILDQHGWTILFWCIVFLLVCCCWCCYCCD